MIEKKLEEIVLAEVLFGKKPNLAIKNKMMGLFSNLTKENQIDLAEIPSINKYSDHTNWLRALSKFELPVNFDEFHLEVLKDTPSESLYLVWLKNFLEEEEHIDCQESILLLAGTCYFEVGGIKTHYDAGTFIQVPKAKHTVKVTSKTPLKFLVQRTAA
jgi:quercetin dioxygenase-like cupin family protein